MRQLASVAHNSRGFFYLHLLSVRQDDVRRAINRRETIRPSGAYQLTFLGGAFDQYLRIPDTVADQANKAPVLNRLRTCNVARCSAGSAFAIGLRPFAVNDPAS